MNIPGAGDFVLHIDYGDGRRQIASRLGEFSHILTAYAGVRAAARAWPEYADDLLLLERRFGFIPVQVGRGAALVADADRAAWREIGALATLVALLAGAVALVVRAVRR